MNLMSHAPTCKHSQVYSHRSICSLSCPHFSLPNMGILVFRQLVEIALAKISPGLFVDKFCFRVTARVSLYQPRGAGFLPDCSRLGGTAELHFCGCDRLMAGLRNCHARRAAF